MPAKRKRGSNYVHKEKHNPNARESDERRTQMLKSLEIKRLRKIVEKQTEFLKAYINPESAKRPKLDPLYDLKGAARPAREFYPQPGLSFTETTVDIFVQYEGRLSEHAEGLKLLQSMLELGLATHNVSMNTKESISIFRQMLLYDKIDVLVSC